MEMLRDIGLGAARSHPDHSTFPRVLFSSFWKSKKGIKPGTRSKGKHQPPVCIPEPKRRAPGPGEQLCRCRSRALGGV